MRRIPTFRKARTAAAILTLIATTGALLLVSAAPASAVTNGWTVVRASKPTIYPATAGQAAGNENVTTTDDGAGVTVGDQLKLTVNDNGDGSDNCALTNDFIEFAAPPTLTVTGPTTGAPTYSVVLASSAGACTTAGKTDQVIITATSSGASGTFTLSGIQYTTGSDVAAGDVAITGTSNVSAVTVTNAKNATISVFRVTGNTPPVGVAENTTGNAISDVTIEEFSTGSLGTGNVCLHIDTNQGQFSAVGGVAVSGGGASASAAQVGGNAVATTSRDVTFAYTASTTAPTTITVSGLKFDSTGGFDHVFVQVGVSGTDRDTACGAGNVDIVKPITFVAFVDRLGGGDRFATAQIIFDDAFGCDNNVIIARGDNFPDALAAAYLARFEGTGILLVNTNDIPASTLNALRLEGVKNVFLVGGTSAISTDVENQFKAEPQHVCGGALAAGNPPPMLTVTRIAGQTRYETAQNVAEFPGLTNPGTTDMNLDANEACANFQKVVTAVVASGENFPDALAAGPLAFEGTDGWCGTGGELPLLLTAKDSLSPEAAAALVNLNIKQVILMGGTSAVSTATEASITALGINVIRVAGTTRQLTAAALATLMADHPNIDMDDGSIGLSRPDTFPDALTLGPAAGVDEAAILLTDSTTSLGSAAAGVLTNLSAKVNSDGQSPDCTDDVNVAGGTAALSAGVVTEMLTAVASQLPTITSNGCGQAED